MTRKHKKRSIVRGNKIFLDGAPPRRKPVFDRSVPATWEEYEQLRAERQLEAERSKLSLCSTDSRPEARAEAGAPTTDTTPVPPRTRRTTGGTP